MLVNSRVFYETINLAQALRSLPNYDAPRVLWVDAVRINQQDPKEQNVQVAMMWDIYPSAFSGTNVETLDPTGNSALGTAIYQQHIEIVKLLLSCGASPNPVDSDVKTYLMYPSIWVSSISSIHFWMQARILSYQRHCKYTLHSTSTHGCRNGAC